MKKHDPFICNIDVSLSEDMNTLACKTKTSVRNEIVLASILAGAVVAIAHDHSIDPHKFAEAVCGTIMEFIDKPGSTKSNQKLS